MKATTKTKNSRRTQHSGRMSPLPDGRLFDKLNRQKREADAVAARNAEAESEVE